MAEGDRVAYLGTISGINDGELFGFPATGKRMSVRGINFFRLKDGQIVERWGRSTSSGSCSSLAWRPRRVAAAPRTRAGRSGPR